jgi:hypothetical protein
MSITVTNLKSERQQIVSLRRQAVFMFIATHLDADGCFSESDQYIANTVAGSNRVSVNRARKSLEETGDVMVVEKDRRDENRNQLPNRVRPVPVRTFWVREWVRGGSKTESSEHGENASEQTRIKSFNPQELTPQTKAPVNTAGTRVHEHKNSSLYTEQPISISVELQNTAYRACWSEHGFDPPVAKAIRQLRNKLVEVQAQQKASPANKYWGEKIVEIKQNIADLEGRHE